MIVLGAAWLLLGAALIAYVLWMAPRVEITWETATEQGTAGFTLYRSQAEDGEFTLVNEDGMIASRGGPVEGAAYTYVDENVAAGETYYYVLEEIETDGSRRQYKDDVFEYEVPGTSIWIVLLIVLSCIMGALMVAAGLKESKNK